MHVCLPFLMWNYLNLLTLTTGNTSRSLLCCRGLMVWTSWYSKMGNNNMGLQHEIWIQIWMLTEQITVHNFSLQFGSLDALKEPANLRTETVWTKEREAWTRHYPWICDKQWQTDWGRSVMDKYSITGGGGSRSTSTCSMQQKQGKALVVWISQHAFSSFNV